MSVLQKILLFPFTLILYTSCDPKCCDIVYNPGNWVRLHSLNITGRSEAVSFTIDETAYIGTGWDGANHRLGDFWKYNAVLDSWEQIASLPSEAERSAAVGFSVCGNGYCGTGFNGSGYLNDFYRFDPKANQWTKLASVFPGAARSGSIAFSINNFGYVGTGYDGNQALADMYKYDPVGDLWISIPYKAEARYGAVSTIFLNKAYIVAGRNGKDCLSDYWSFSPDDSVNRWQRLNDIANGPNQAFDDAYTSITRTNAIFFTIGNQAYLSTGINNGSPISQTWAYDFATDLWMHKTSFEGTPTSGAVGFSAGGRGFLVTGITKNSVTDQFWEFRPEDQVNSNDN